MPDAAAGRGEVAEEECYCLFVLGTRPEAIKLVPLVQAMERSRIVPLIVDTGQHPDMVPKILDLAGVAPDFQLNVASPGASIIRTSEKLMAGLEDVLDTLRGGPERRAAPRLFSGVGSKAGRYPAMVVVQGDTVSAQIGAQVAAMNRLLVVHVEAGLRTGDRWNPFPEEINRLVIGQLASLHLPPTWMSAQALVREGFDVRQMLVTGNTGVDAILWAAGLDLPWPDPRLDRLDTHEGQVVAATMHRRENWGGGITRIAEGLATIAAARPDVLVVLPMHPNPKVRESIEPVLGGLDNVILVEPLEYPAFAKLLKRADLAISDSGGVQEEAPSLGTPVLVTRESSERMEGVTEGVLELVGTDPMRISSVALRLLDDPSELAAMTSRANPFGDGHASERIVSALEYLVFGGTPPVAFGSPFDRLRVLTEAGYSSAEVRAVLSGAYRRS
ncbi:MAG: UDP-N-acetylglucosamine 2-epimerase (non-hydrolyzing) [Actinobacteria bacterium]|nr:UDP-N-acetylglucosamine 2-epimerase (non-hydrolyzing) [Actinomycetota bacterium]